MRMNYTMYDVACTLTSRPVTALPKKIPNYMHIILKLFGTLATLANSFKMCI